MIRIDKPTGQKRVKVYIIYFLSLATNFSNQTCQRSIWFQQITLMKEEYSLLHSSEKLPNCGGNHVHLICIIIRFNSFLLGKVE